MFSDYNDDSPRLALFLVKDRNGTIFWAVREGWKSDAQLLCHGGTMLELRRDYEHGRYMLYTFNGGAYECFNPEG